MINENKIFKQKTLKIKLSSEHFTNSSSDISMIDEASLDFPVVFFECISSFVTLKTCINHMSYKFKLKNM